MPMAADSQKNSCHGKKGEHFFAGLWASISPSLNAGVHALCELIHLHHVHPSNAVRIFTIRKVFVIDMLSNNWRFN